MNDFLFLVALSFFSFIVGICVGVTLDDKGMSKNCDLMGAFRNGEDIIYECHRK